MEKLYVVVRADLKPGAQIAQAGHAVAAFARRYNSTFEVWVEGANNLVVLSVTDETELNRLHERIIGAGAKAQRVHEPDLADQLTAIVFEGTKEAARAVSSLSLALREPRALIAV